MRKSRFLSSAAILTLTLSPALGAELADSDLTLVQSCAVSELNGKLEGAGGYIDSNTVDGGRYRVGGSITAPIGCEYGFQVDGKAGELGGPDAYGVGAHLFKRDPSSYLAGIYGEYGSIGGNDLFRVGVEAEKYLDDATISFIAGFEDSQRTSEDAFGAVRVGYYINDNFQINVGGAHFLTVTAATAGFEYQTDYSNVSLFADAAVGSNDHKSIWVGVRYFFGPEKTLKRRHREDDPINWIAVLESVAKTSNPATAASTPSCPDGFVWNPDFEGGTCVTPPD